MTSVPREDCPHVEQLRLLVAGTVEAEDATILRRHLECCPSCTSRFLTLSTTARHEASRLPLAAQPATAAGGATATLSFHRRPRTMPQ